MIENACPYAPGAIKPDSMPRPQGQISILRKLFNGKFLLMLLSIVALTLLYSHSYPVLNWGGSPVLFQDWYIVKMSIYTYVSGMIAYYFREQRRKNKA